VNLFNLKATIPLRKAPANSKTWESTALANSNSNSEEQGHAWAAKLIAHIKNQGGRYLKDEHGGLHAVIDGRRISLCRSHENHQLSRLLIDVCDVTTRAWAAQVAIERLGVHAYDNADRLRLRRFSAISEDGERLYVPIEGGSLLLVSDSALEIVANGDNEDQLWVEHPYSEPLRYSDEADVWDGLQVFERLLVDTQACSDPAMRWMVAMNAGLFPYIRDTSPARMILELIGGSQSGKTTGAQRFTILHGLGEVQIDVSVATLGNQGDIGLLVLDNKEQANFTQQLIDYCLRLSTGGERGRSNSDGSVRGRLPGRPVTIITTIEGVPKTELQSRCVAVQYVRDVQGKALPRAGIESDIRKSRHSIGAAIMWVLTRYFAIRGETPAPNPIPAFEEHFQALCDLLRAYAFWACKPPGWSEGIIAQWNAAIVGRDAEDDDLEHPISRTLSESLANTGKKTSYQGVRGMLYVTETADLLTQLQKLGIRDLQLPKNPNGLSRRLSSGRFQGFTFLRTDTPGVSEVKRRSKKKPIGFFLPD
jgi:hypothetical protein